MHALQQRTPDNPQYEQYCAATGNYIKNHYITYFIKETHSVAVVVVVVVTVCISAAALSVLLQLNILF